MFSTLNDAGLNNCFIYMYFYRGTDKMDNHLYSMHYFWPCVSNSNLFLVSELDLYSLPNNNLTLYQMTKFRLALQRTIQMLLKTLKVCFIGQKTLWEKKKMLFTSASKLSLCGKRFTLYHTIPTLNNAENKALIKHCGKRRKCW